MSSSTTTTDPRVAELAAVNSRITTLVALLKARHTPESVMQNIKQAEESLGDHTPEFITIDSVPAFSGTRHMHSLFKLSHALEIRADMGRRDISKECVKLLERKVELLKNINDFSTL